MKKIIFLDIDGTLLNTKKEIPEKARQGVFALQERGYQVAIATGRGPFMFREIREELGIDSYVSFNGQLVVFRDETIYANPFSEQQLEALITASKEKNHPLVFMNDERMMANVRHDTKVKEAIGSLKFPHPEYDPEFYRKAPIYQILLFCEEGEEQYIHEQFPDMQVLRWHPYAVDIIPKESSKAKGIEIALDYFQISIENAYAFGDGINDLEMLKAVGTGVAMGNSHPEVKLVADYTTKHVDEDGLYYAFQQLKLL